MSGSERSCAPRRPPWLTGGAAAVVGVLLLAGCSTPDTGAVADELFPTASAEEYEPGPDVLEEAGLGGYYGQALDWRECQGGLECAEVVVPRDYAKPGDGEVVLSVARRPARSAEKRLGAIVVNPGGPGGSGVGMAIDAQYYFSKQILERFDIVGFDPRGVAASDPIACGDARFLDSYLAADATPDSTAEINRLDDLSRQFAQLCSAESGEMLPHLGTFDVARDLDILRAALGEDQLSFMGKSYGTFIGAAYADLFPQRVGRMVLDGAIDPAISGEQLALDQAIGFEQALDRFIADCNRQTDCPLPDGVRAGRQTISSLLSRIDARPLPTDQRNRPLTEALATYGLAGGLYDDIDGWGFLRLALARALEGDGSDLLFLVDLYTDRTPDGEYASNATEALVAVNCIDKPAGPPLAEVPALAREWARKAPIFGPYLAWSGLPCVYWPIHAAEPPRPLPARGAPPILILGTTHDPATPVRWARSLAEQMASGVYLEWQGDGHTAHGRGSACVDDIVDRFYLEGTVPVDASVCPP